MKKLLLIFIFFTANATAAVTQQQIGVKIDTKVKFIPVCNPFLKVQPITPCEPIKMDRDNKVESPEPPKQVQQIGVKIAPEPKPIPKCNPFLKVQPVTPCEPIKMNK